MKKLFLLFAVSVIVVLGYFFFIFGKKPLVNPAGIFTPTEKPLLAYSFEKLRQTRFPPNNIKLDRPFRETSANKFDILFSYG